MDELMSQTRDNLRVLNSVPGFSFMANFSVDSIRRMPSLPGLEVALGVTAHQLSSSIKAAVQTVKSGQDVVEQLQYQVGEAVQRASLTAEDLGRQGTGIALGAARGVIAGVREFSADVGDVTQDAMKGVLAALGKTDADPHDTVRGAMYGVVQEASEAGMPMAEAVGNTLKAARDAAAELGMTEAEAGALAAQAAVDSSGQFDSKTEAEIKQAVLDELLSAEERKKSSG